MRIYGSIQVSFWENNDIQNLSDRSKLLALYLLTAPHSNMLGCFRLPDGYIVEDLKWDSQSTQEAFSELSKIDFLTRDQISSWVVIHHFLKWNPIQNPRQGVGIEKIFEFVPRELTVMEPLIKGLLTYGKFLNKGFVDRLQTLQKTSETLSEECVADKEQDQEQNQDQDTKHIAEEMRSVEPTLRSKAIEVLNFLNEKTDRMYRLTDTNINLVIARLKTGASVADCRQIIAKKYREWKDNPNMAKFVRPETLFNPRKFESYIGELVRLNEEGKKDGKN